MTLPSIGHQSAEPQTLDEILDWHRTIVEALVEQRISVHSAIRLGLPVMHDTSG